MRDNLKKMAGYYKPYMGIFFADLFFAFLSAGVALTIPLIVRYVTSTVIYYPTDQVMPTILKIGLLMIVLLALQFYSNFFIGNYGHIMGAKMEYNMRREIFEHYQKLSFSFFDEQKVGQLLSRVTSDLFDISELLHHGPENVIICTIKIIGSLIILSRINVILMIAILVLVPFMLAYAWIFNVRMKRAFKKNRKNIAEINSQIEDSLSGIRVVKSFANEDEEMRKFKVGNDAFLASKSEAYVNMGTYHAGITTFTTLFTLIVLLSGTFFITKGTLSVTDLVTFLLYINVFTEPVKTIIDFTEQFQNGYTGFERFQEILHVVPDIKDAPDAEELKDVKGQIEFDHVSFHYQGHEDRVLDDVCLKADAGEYVALVGPSGAGKTTICNLIPRFYEVTGGCIRVDGKDIRKISMKSLRDHIGVVQQDVYLFMGTVFDNIAYGKPGATREEVIEAAKNANAHDFIMALPDGYDTDIGQRGVKLSGGQKQRLSIARVFLKNPPILIFDEATSALDNESEKVVQDSLEKLAKNRTTFVIAHRLTTIRNAKKILVLTDKGIEESGTHEELMAQKGIYEALYTLK